DTTPRRGASKVMTLSASGLLELYFKHSDTSTISGSYRLEIACALLLAHFIRIGANRNGFRDIRPSLLQRKINRMSPFVSIPGAGPLKNFPLSQILTPRVSTTASMSLL